VAARCRELCPDEPGEGLVDADVATAEPDGQRLTRVVDLPAGHRRDPRELLGVKQVEAAGDAVDGGTPGSCSNVWINACRWAWPAATPVGLTGRVRTSRGAIRRAAAQEDVFALVGQVRRSVQEPMIEVGLTHLVESDTAGAQPVQQGDRGPQGDGRVPGGGVGAGAALGVVAGPGAAPARSRTRSKHGGRRRHRRRPATARPAARAGPSPRPARATHLRDQQRSEVVDGAPGGLDVRSGVRERDPSLGQRRQQRRARSAAEPVERGTRMRA